MEVLTEAMLRSQRPWGEKTVAITEDTLVTPDARRFAQVHGITLAFPQRQTMPRTAVDLEAEFPYTDAETGAPLREKPEDMTHLRGSLLVKKNHPRIALRGQLDLLQAELIGAQITADAAGRTALRGELGQLLDFTRTILSAEVREEPLPDLRLLGYDAPGLRRASHQVEQSVGIPHPVPDYGMGPVCAALNLLRAKVRVAELAAAAAFDGQDARPDLLLAMNRLSSAVYLLFCKEVKHHG